MPLLHFFSVPYILRCSHRPKDMLAGYAVYLSLMPRMIRDASGDLQVYQSCQMQVQRSLGLFRGLKPHYDVRIFLKQKLVSIEFYLRNTAENHETSCLP